MENHHYFNGFIVILQLVLNNQDRLLDRAIYHGSQDGYDCYDPPSRKCYWLVVSSMTFSFHFIYGMSSFPLTNSIIFQDA